MTDPARRADCSQCAALCCAAFPFENSEDFGVEKAAGEPCLHLRGGGQCGIHADKAERGFSGCVRYDCAGVGQLVTQSLFGGRTWQDEPDLLAPMLEAFLGMRLARDVEDLLVAAGGLPLDATERQNLTLLSEELATHQPWTLTTLADLEQSDLPSRVRKFVATLARHVSREH